MKGDISNIHTDSNEQMNSDSPWKLSAFQDNYSSMMYVFLSQTFICSNCYRISIGLPLEDVYFDWDMDRSDQIVYSIGIISSQAISLMNFMRCNLYMCAQLVDSQRNFKIIWMNIHYDALINYEIFWFLYKISVFVYTSIHKCI